MCPFLERACPMGEEAARRCWKRMASQRATVVLDERFEYDVNCLIADRMFGSGSLNYS